jgi:enterobacteria phage integrase
VAPRNRHPSRKHWPPYLYERRGIYFWRHPETRQEYPLGKDRVYAFTEAIAANRHLADSLRASLVDRITGNAERSVGAFAARYLAKLKVAPNTLKAYRSLAKRTIDTFGAETPLTSITPLRISEELEKLGARRIAQAWRSFLRDLFREACLIGWVDANPVRDTRRLSVEVKRRRLTWEQFLEVYAKLEVDWLRNAVALAVTTGQRREDVASAKFADVREGFWWVEQGKTGVRLQIPLDLRLDGFLSVGEAVRQCRTTGALSPFLIHQTKPYGSSPVGSNIHPDTISRRFSEAVEAAGLGGDHPPTFHELRSLAARRYALQGQGAQALLGHKSAAMTEVYKDTRGAEWTRVIVGK